jgi:hypothetical protein
MMPAFAPHMWHELDDLDEVSASRTSGPVMFIEIPETKEAKKAVTANTASTGGFPVAASASVTVPTTGASAEALYGITASSTANVAFLYPG